MRPSATQIQLLREIEDGKRAFQANSRGDEDQKEFQPQAEELIELYENQYLSNCTVSRETSSGKGYIDFVFVEGLTAKGRRALEEASGDDNLNGIRTMLDCPKCGHALRSSAQYCDNCGFQVATTQASTLQRPNTKAATSDSLVGKVLRGSYQVVEEIGSGAMGRVYRGRNVRLETDIAIKVIDKRHLSDAMAIKRFEREARLAASIKHPNVVVIHDLGNTDDPDTRGFIVMELADGESLKALLRKVGRLDANTTDRLMRQVCAAVAAAHEKGIIHRDLKPDNIMISQKGDVKVLDFGLAKIFNSPNEPAITHVGTLLGTPFYMSPEQCRGEELDTRSDVYSLAAVAFEMLAGRPPFRGPEVIRQHQFEDPPPLDSQLAIPPLVEGVIRKGLSKKKEHRHCDAAELENELRAAFESDVPKGSEAVLAETISDTRPIVNGKPIFKFSENTINTILSQFEEYLLDPNTIRRACRLIETNVDQFANDLAAINDSRVAADQTPEGVFHLMNTYEKAGALVLALYVRAAYEGEPVVTEALVRGLMTISHAPKLKHTPGEPHLYPALVLTYAAGIAAVAGNRFTTLVALLKTKIRTRTYPHGHFGAYVLNHYRVIDKDIATDLPPVKSYHTPISSYFFSLLRKPLRRVIKFESEYNESFFSFEYLLALVSAQSHEEVWESPEAPEGSYLWEQNLRQPPYIFQVTDKELARQKDSWPWFKAGIFNGSFEDFLQFKAKVDESIKRDIRSKYSLIAI